MPLNFNNPLIPHFVYKPWGGSRLATLKGLSVTDGEPLGETWEVSRHQDGVTKDSQGQPLSHLTKEQLPYLVKFIDTAEELSVQVHPDDAYAAQYENSAGKTECWVILEAQPGAGLYLGFKPGIEKKDFFAAIDRGEDLSTMLQFFPVKPGDFFYVPAKTIHALGGGLTLAEIQQSSGITYRVWDWNRVDKDGKSRQLHIEQAKAVLNFDANANQPLAFKLKNIFATKEKNVFEHADFKLSYYTKQAELKSLGISNRVVSLINLGQKLMLSSATSSQVINPYECVLLNREETIQVDGGDFLVVE